jgi:hypothetical protein
MQWRTTISNCILSPSSVGDLVTRFIFISSWHHWINCPV